LSEEAVMGPEDLDDYEAEDWDEETLGLEWNEAEAQNVLREVVPLGSDAD
jgi:hypothetical protein